jgi:glutaminyl-peptide cyclotransferase
MFRIALLLLAAVVPATTQRSAQMRAREYTFKVVKSYPHDAKAFTQGLEFRDGFLYEGTGQVGRSALRKVELATGKVLQEYLVPRPFFGEGITVVNQQIVQLTWQHQTGFLYDKASFKLIRNFDYAGEGWGITNDGKQIYMTDGSAQIKIWDPNSLKEVRRITVKDGAKAIDSLNEIESVKGELFANIWHSDRIARISPADGRVVGWIEMSGLLPPAERPDPEAVLNGIAYDAAGDRLFVTGKLWPKVFEIRVVAK